VVTVDEFVTVEEPPRMELNGVIDNVAPAENRRTKLLLLLSGAEDEEVPDDDGVVL